MTIIKNAFVLDESVIRRLEVLMRELDESNDDSDIRYLVTLKNGQTISPLSLEEVLNLENVDKTKIIYLRVSIYSFGKNSIVFEFTNYIDRPMTYHLETEDQKSFLYYKEKIEEFLKSLEPTYSFVSINYWAMYIFLVLPAFLIFSGLVFYILGIFNLEVTSFSLMLIPLFITYLVLVVFLTNRFILLMMIIFPVGQFKIGHGIKKFEDLKWIRIAVLVPIYLTLFAVIVEKIF